MKPVPKNFTISGNWGAGLPGAFADWTARVTEMPPCGGDGCEGDPGTVTLTFNNGIPVPLNGITEDEIRRVAAQNGRPDVWVARVLDTIRELGKLYGVEVQV